VIASASEAIQRLSLDSRVRGNEREIQIPLVPAEAGTQTMIWLDCFVAEFVIGPATSGRTRRVPRNDERAGITKTGGECLP